VQSLEVPESVTVGKEGYLEMAGKRGRGYRQRWIVLRNFQLSWFKKKTDKKPSGMIDMKNFEWKREDKPFSWCITTKPDGLQNHFRAKEMADFEDWLSLLKENTSFSQVRPTVRLS
jgi:hypothetical protein